MYNALARFVCARSIIFCQNVLQITQGLPGNWIGGGKRFSWASRAGAPLPSRASLARPVRSCTHYFQAPVTQATLQQIVIKWRVQ